MNIAIDAMGGDDAPLVVVQGAVNAARKHGIPVTLVGPPDVLAAELAKLGDVPPSKIGRAHV